MLRRLVIAGYLLVSGVLLPYSDGEQRRRLVLSGVRSSSEGFVAARRPVGAILVAEEWQHVVLGLPCAGSWSSMGMSGVRRVSPSAILRLMRAVRLFLHEDGNHLAVEGDSESAFSCCKMVRGSELSSFCMVAIRSPLLFVPVALFATLFWSWWNGDA